MITRLISLAALCLFLRLQSCVAADSSDRANAYCIWTRSVSSGQTQYVFLRKTDMSLTLYDSIWNKDNSLSRCITSDEHGVIESYLSRCWEGVGSFSETPDARFDMALLTDPTGPCQTAGLTEESTLSVRKPRDLGSVHEGSVNQERREGSSQTLHRSKRAWMIPGTLWCGSGNKAEAFSDLGVFEETDKCCREHDHCEQTIPSFSFDHGVFNTNIFTLSHCDCDHKFRRCLLGVNNTMSNLVGYGYFNLLKMRCFEFSSRMQCAKRTWWGMCAISELAQYAVVKDATNYTDILPEQELDLGISFQQTITLQQSQVSKNTMDPFNKQPKDSKEQSPVLTSPVPSVTTLKPLKSEAPSPKKTDKQPKGKFEMCDLYKDLDSCHLQIPPLQEKYGLRNQDMKTLYHCNCTARLVQKILNKELDETDQVHSLMMDFVSQSCFTLQQSESCLKGKSCSTQPSEGQLVRNWRKEVAAGRHLVDYRRKLKRMNLKRSKRKDSPIRLYKKCTRMHNKLQRPSNLL
ncbi:hypothetical protein DNTS_013041 [Danionella cerebrum]|uniref:phospholipase A2 n=1 Tax=Danionella cerebrum TaxID=2873325 RepID=A0A553QJS5_9TELE|nr:hypothetical protein DNTS_013041 [Danionella translucida]